ncbi:MAG: hypothetical protein ACFFCS_17480 [Candidatus Hodarchaeota archaeon]
MKVNKIKVNYETELRINSKKDLDFLFEELDEFFKNRFDYNEFDKKYFRLIYGELLNHLDKLEGALKNYLEMRLKRLELNYERLI